VTEALDAYMHALQKPSKERKRTPVIA